MKHYPFYAVRPLLPVFPEPEDPESARKRWILVQGKNVLIRKDQESSVVLQREIFPAGVTKSDPVYLGIKDDLLYYAIGVSSEITLGKGWISVPVRDLYGKVTDSDLALASYAVRILDFDHSALYCGRCGAKTRPLTTERARICSSCNHIIYPRISPAIIVLITKGDEVLLARSPNSPPGLYSVIAGFNEPGENLEQTVHREVEEEVGITVQNLRYFGSEPWPFPDSLMIGFVAEYAGGEIRIDNQEIEASGWFSRSNLPPYPSRASITNALIDAWVQQKI